MKLHSENKTYKLYQRKYVEYVRNNRKRKYR